MATKQQTKTTIDRPTPFFSKFSVALVALGLTLASLIGLVIALGHLAIDRTPTAAAGDTNLAMLGPYWITSAAVWIGLTGLLLTLPRSRTRLSHPIVAGALILLIAGGTRLAVVITHTPSLSDDIHRYVFDGNNTLHGENPYLVNPESRAKAPHRPTTEPLWPGERMVVAQVNNPELHTIYLPMSQAVFALCALLDGGNVANLHTTERTFRFVFIAIDLIVIILLLIALGRAGRSLWWAVAYAWHPLVITEVAGSGHQDVVGVVLLVTALMLAGARRHVGWWTTSLALASLVKPMVLPIAALLLRRRGWCRWILSAVIGAAVCAAVAGPLLSTDAFAPVSHLRATSQRFALKWAHFGGFYEVTLAGIEQATNDPDLAWQEPEVGHWTNDDQERLARAICLAMTLLVVVVTFIKVRDPWRGARIVLFAMVLLSSTAHPWYLLWALALLPMAPSPALWMATLTLPWGYAQFGDVIGWRTPTWVLIAAYAPVYAVLLADLWRPNRRSPASTASLKSERT